MPRRNWNDGQELVFEDLNAITKSIERTLYDRIYYEMILRSEDAFFDDSFLVEYATSTSVTVRIGSGFQSDSGQSNPEPEKRLLYKSSQTTHSITDPDGSLDRIDILVVQAAIEDDITVSRKFKHPSTEVVSDQDMVVQKDWEASISIVAGTPGITPVAPSTPAGYIKIAEMEVTAASGIGGAGAVTDTRALIKIGEEAILNSIGYNRLSPSTSLPFKTAFAEIDALLYRGRPNYQDYDDLAAHPSAPAADRVRLYVKDGVLYHQDESSVVTPIISGEGDVGGADWSEPSGFAPEKVEEYDREVYKFPAGGDNKLLLSLKVPNTYVTGRPISIFLAMYSPSSSNTIKLETTSTLIRENLDAVDSDTNQHSSTNSALTNTVAKQYRFDELDLTDGSGQINGLDVDAGDLIEVELVRGTDTDTDEVRLIASGTQLRFA